MLNRTIIDNLPLAFTAQSGFFQKQGEHFLTDFFDEFGHLDKTHAVSVAEMTQRMPDEYGSATTRAAKVRAAINYLLAEGTSTGKPQIFRCVGRYYFVAEEDSHVQS